MHNIYENTTKTFVHSIYLCCHSCSLFLSRFCCTIACEWHENVRLLHKRWKFRVLANCAKDIMWCDSGVCVCVCLSEANTIHNTHNYVCWTTPLFEILSTCTHIELRDGNNKVTQFFSLSLALNHIVGVVNTPSFLQIGSKREISYISDPKCHQLNKLFTV